MQWWPEIAEKSSTPALGTLISSEPETTQGCDDAYFVNARMLMVNLDQMKGIQRVVMTKLL